MSDRVVIIGAGRMGLALGTALTQRDAADWILFQGRSSEPPPHPLFDQSDGVSYRPGVGSPPGNASVVLLAVPDDAVHEVANELARQGDGPRGCTALHLSGALSTDVLAPLHGAGYLVGSMHPLQTVADPWSGAERLAGSAFAIAGEPGAMVTARRLVHALEGHPLVIPPALRALYHAAAVFASNYVLVAAGIMARTLAEAGIDEGEAVAAALPLMRGTMDNLEQLGMSAALTGPVARGDVDTVRLHLSRLSTTERRLYCALGIETLRLARTAGLDPARAQEIERLLAD